MSHPSRRPSVLHMPDYTESNPYQDNLVGGIEAGGADVVLESPDEPVIFSVLRSARRHEADAIHLHWLWRFYRGDNPAETALKSVAFLVELLLLRLTGHTIVWTVHNLSPHDTEGRFEAVYLGLVARLVSGIVVHSKSAVDAVADYYGLSRRTRAKIEVIPHGHYIDNYPNEIEKGVARDVLGLDPELPTFVFTGMIRPYKNVDALIDAVTDLEQRGTEIQLVIAGKPVDEDYGDLLREQVDATASERILYHPQFIADDDLQIYLNAADAVVLPFEESLTSGSALLALSFGRAVILPEMGCLADLDRGAIHYDPATEDVRDGLQRALQSDLEAVGEAGYDFASTLAWDEIGRETRNLYTS